MNSINAITLATAASLLFASCNSPEEKKELPVEVKTDTVKAPEKTISSAKSDTIEVYRYKGAEVYINNEFIKSATEEEKALFGYYCYFFNTSCADSKHCKLTEALGLGEQNSKAHQQLVLKWFNDSETVDLAKEGGRITPTGTKNKSWYEELRMIKKGGGLVIVQYISAWSTPSLNGKGKGLDEYEFTPDRIKVINRSHEEMGELESSLH